MRSSANRLAPDLSSRALSDLSSASCTYGRRAGAMGGGHGFERAGYEVKTECSFSEPSDVLSIFSFKCCTHANSEQKMMRRRSEKKSLTPASYTATTASAC